jgi:hypothetical protein
MTTDLDDLKQAWSKMQVRVARLERAASTRRTRDALRPAGLRRVIRLGVWLVLVVAAGSFWFDHRDVPPLLVSGLALHAYGILAIVLEARQLRALRKIDGAAPIVTLQRQLAELDRLRARCSLALGLPWWLLWVPCALIGVAWLTGHVAYDAAWVWSSLAVGVVGLVASLVIARRLAGRPVQSAAWRRLIDDLSGRSATRAAEDLDEVSQFEREEPPGPGPG